jgi:hypothetical protein
MTNKPKRRLASDEAHSWARNLHLGNPLAKLLLCMLAGYVNSDGECWVGVNSLAQDCDCDRKTIMRRLEWLEDRGHITRQEQWISEDGDRNSRGDGRHTTSLIKLVIENVEYSSTIESMSDEELQRSVNQVSGPFQGPQVGPCQGPQNEVSGPLAVRLESHKEGPQYEPYLEPKRKTRVRARRPEGARSRAEEPSIGTSLKSVITADDFRATVEVMRSGKWAFRGTRVWNDLKDLASRHGIRMPETVYHRAEDPPNTNGRHFPTWLWDRAVKEAAPARDPPPSASTNGHQPGEGDDEQFTAGLRRI